LNRFTIILLSLFIVGLSVFALHSFRKISQLEKENQQLQEKVKNLTSLNKEYQNQINIQLQEQATKETEEDAEAKAVQFVNIYNNLSLAPQTRINQLKQLMTADAFNKKFGTTQQPTSSTNRIQSKVDIKNVQSFDVNNTKKVTIDYDYIGSVDNTENFVERMNIVVHLVISNGKWLVDDFEITYKEGPEGHRD